MSSGQIAGLSSPSSGIINNRERSLSPCTRTRTSCGFPVPPCPTPTKEVEAVELLSDEQDEEHRPLEWAEASDRHLSTMSHDGLLALLNKVRHRQDQFAQFDWSRHTEEGAEDPRGEVEKDGEQEIAQTTTHFSEVEKAEKPARVDSTLKTVNTGLSHKSGQSASSQKKWRRGTSIKLSRRWPNIRWAEGTNEPKPPKDAKYDDNLKIVTIPFEHYRTISSSGRSSSQDRSRLSSMLSMTGDTSTSRRLSQGRKNGTLVHLPHKDSLQLCRYRGRSPRRQPSRWRRLIPATFRSG